MKVFAEKLKSAIPVLSPVISLVAAWFFVPAYSGPPLVVLFLLVVTVSSLIYCVRREKTWFDTVLYFGVLVLSFFTILRANVFLQFFDLLFIFFFGSLLVRPMLEEFNIFTILVSPLIVIASTFTAKNIFPFTYKIPVKNTDKNYFRELIPTILVTLLVLVITIPLLASANPFFNKLLQQTVQFFNLQWFFTYLFADRLDVYIVRCIVALVLIYALPRLLTLGVEGVKTLETKQSFSINYLYPKYALAGLLIIFFITQLQLYFASPETLRSIGYTNSKLTNEVFFQVTIVAFIVSFLAYMDKSREKWNTILTYFLTVEAFFLIGIAFKSVYDYSSLNGFTQKRLWGFASMAWLTGVLVAFIFYFKNQFSHLRFMKQILTYTLVMIILVNLANFDYLIYHVSKPTVAGAIDYGYISNLSPDGKYNKEVLPIVVADAEKSNYLDVGKTNAVYTILANIDYLKHKYQTKHEVNAFNLSDYQEYLTVKDIDTQAYTRKIVETQDKYTPKPQPTPTPKL